MRRYLLPSMFLLATVFTGCGGSDSESSSNHSKATTGSTGGDGSTTTAKSAATTAKSGATAAGTNGQKLCTIIRKVQGDLRPGAVSAAYLAQFTIAAASDADLLKSFGPESDSAAKATCPEEYATFLRQAAIKSLTLA